MLKNKFETLNTVVPTVVQSVSIVLYTQPIQFC